MPGGGGRRQQQQTPRQRRQGRGHLGDDCGGGGARREDPGVEIEALSWVLLLSAPPPAQADTPAAPPEPYSPATASFRPLFAPDTGEFINVAIHQRRDLRPGALISGPAVIAEDETSTVVSRLFDAKIDRFGYIELIRRSV